MGFAKHLLGLLLVGLASGSPQYPQGDTADVVLDPQCPLYTACVTYFQCGKDGFIVEFGEGLLDVRGGSKKPEGVQCTPPDAPNTPGICCEKLGARPEPVVTCPPGNACVSDEICNPSGGIIDDGAGIIVPRFRLECHLGSEIGVCCKPPELLCSDIASESCVLKSVCDGAIGVAAPNPYNQCYLNKVTYDYGVCCPPSPVCSVPETCKPVDQCGGGSPLAGAVQGTYKDCYLNDYTPGVCCPPPIPIVEYCPGTSTCVPDGFCEGDALDSFDNFISYDSAKTWTKCPLTGGAYGFCCIKPEIVEPVYPVANQCGVRNYGLNVRVADLGSLDSQFAEFPWQAILFFSNYTFKCGASLVGDRWLLTGAHCLNGYQYGDFKVRLGEWQVNTYDEPLPYFDSDISAIYIHPNFNSRNLHNDIAVIELVAPVPFDYHINSVCLPPPNSPPLLDGTTCFSTGWGKDSFTGNFQVKLKKVDLPFVESYHCQSLLRKTRLGRFFKLDESFLCAGGEYGKDTCTGDGGGPLVCQDEYTGRYVIQGITAWGIGCGEQDVPGVYANVGHFTEWLSGIINPYAVPVVDQNPYGRK